MGTATAESLREVGLEPPPAPRAVAPAPQPRAPTATPRPELAPHVGGTCKRLACALALGGAFLMGLNGLASVDQMRYQLREVERLTERSLEFLYDLQRAGAIRDEQTQNLLRELDAVMARAMRAERRARRLGRGKRP